MLTRFCLALLALAIPTLAVIADDDLYGDPLPAGAKTRLGTMRYKYGFNYTPTVTPDGKNILASDNWGLRRYDITGAELKLPKNYASYVPAAFSADGARAVSAYSTTTVWEVESGKTLITLK